MEELFDQLNEGIQLVESDEDNHIKWRLEFSDILKEVFAYLTGRYYVEIEGKRIRSRRLLSDEVAMELLGYLRMHLNKSTVLSDLSFYDISNVIRFFAVALAEWLLFNAEKYGISHDKWPLIYVGTTNAVYLALLRAKFGGERESIGKTIQVTEQIEKKLEEESQPKPKLSLFGVFKR